MLFVYTKGFSQVKPTVLTEVNIKNNIVYLIKNNTPYTGQLNIDMVGIKSVVKLDSIVSSFVITGNTVQANFKEGMLHGEMLVNDDQQEIIAHINFKEGKLHGVFYVLEKEGVVQMGSYLNGTRNGYFTNYYYYDYNTKNRKRKLREVTNIVQYKKDTLIGVEAKIIKTEGREITVINQYDNGAKTGIHYDFSGGRNIGHRGV